MAVIFTGSTYNDLFNTPRFPKKHTMKRGKVLHPPGRLLVSAANIGLFNPFAGYQLIHSWNFIPAFAAKPWIVTFESAMPRTFGPGSDAVRFLLRGSLYSPLCRRIIAISEYAVRRARRAWTGFDDLMDKVTVVHPNIEAKEASHTYLGGQLIVTFVGNHFARKGGIVALRMAKLAQQRNLPIRFQIISSLQYARGIYTDHQDASVYGPDLEALNLPNVKLMGHLPNVEVMEQMGKSHFLLLPTLHDTYGYSMLESMSMGVPVIATATAAIPEIVRDGDNGFLLPLDVNSIGDWAHLANMPVPWPVYDETFANLAEVAISKLETVIDSPATWERLSSGSLNQIARQHDTYRVGETLEAIYDAAIANSH
jgi:glycosyltransferase involved in cell wall biosynthesis